MSRTRLAPLTALLLAALFLAGCGGGGGEPTVTQTLHDELQSELDAALADLKTERDAKAKEAEARSAAEAEVASLTEQIGSMDDAASDAEGASLNAQLNAAKAKVTELTAEIGTAGAAESLKGKLEAANAKVVRLTAELEAANTSLTSLRGQLTTAQQAQQQAQQQVQEAQQQVQEAQQQAQGQEANQRAENLKAAFPGGRTPEDALVPIAATDSPVKMAATKGRLTLTRGGYRIATLSGNGLRSATMALTRGTDSGKLVVYTDRELSRSLLTHFGSARDASDMTRFELEDPIALADGVIPHFPTTPPNTTLWRIGHNVPTSVVGESNGGDTPTYMAPDDAGTTNMKTAPSYTGYLHGLQGRFVCAGGTNCQVQVVPTYGGTVGSNNRFALESVAVTATSGTLYFKPGSSSLQLYEGGPADGADAEYMVFGYWREDPTSAAGVYQFKVFAEAVEAEAGSISQSEAYNFTDVTKASPLTYDGVAVGAYVEQDPNDPVDTHRQGEFTADVFLEATSEDQVTGTIDDFVTTPTGGSAAPRTAGRWVVTLDLNDKVQLNLAGGGDATEGNWKHGFVKVHQHASGSDTKPPAVTGVFNARIVDFVHIFGAYGAEKR